MPEPQHKPSIGCPPIDGTAPRQATTRLRRRAADMGLSTQKTAAFAPRWKPPSPAAGSQGGSPSLRRCPPNWRSKSPRCLARSPRSGSGRGTDTGGCAQALFYFFFFCGPLLPCRDYRELREHAALCLDVERGLDLIEAVHLLHLGLDSSACDQHSDRVQVLDAPCAGVRVTAEKARAVEPNVDWSGLATPSLPGGPAPPKGVCTRTARQEGIYTRAERSPLGVP